MSIDIKTSRVICDEATPGPWKHGPESHGVYRPSDPRSKPVVDEARTPEDATFIAHARTALPAALDEIERLRAALTPFAEAFDIPDGHTYIPEFDLSVERRHAEKIKMKHLAAAAHALSGGEG